MFLTPPVRFCVVLLSCLVASSWCQGIKAQDYIEVLIVDGQNNHRNWKTTTQLMKHWLTESGRFKVDIATTAAEGIDESFSPDFADYHVVISNYNGQPWPRATQQAFDSFVKEGGGFVTVHAADNAFPKWNEYNRMIGLGGWGGRNQESGPYVYYDEANDKIVRDESEGRGGSHGRQHPFQVIVRDADHPITKGMPGAWMHVKDELYDRLRGPGENMRVLATAYSDPKKGGSGRHEPIMFSINYGKGRVFHLPMGHSNEAHTCTGFITALLRGSQWAAAGHVSIPIPDDFPSIDEVQTRDPKLDPRP